MDTEQIKNYGLDLAKEEAEQSEKDWIFGSSSAVCLAKIPVRERDEYLPLGEVQRGEEDTMDCASRAPVNILETKFNYLYEKDLISQKNKDWLYQNGYVVFVEGVYRIQFSDAFIAINSGTTRNGNSLKAPCEAIRSKDDPDAIQGMIPKAMLPLEPTMTWDQYHDPKRITPEMHELAREFAKRFRINYERVQGSDFELLLDEDLLDVGGYAWPFPNNAGVYERDERRPNHAFVAFGVPYVRIFDNYFDRHDGDFIKQLAKDYNLLSYGYRVYISKEVVPTDTDEDDDVEDWEPELDLDWSWIDWLIQVFKRIFKRQTT